jgi:hypothetical protein
MVLDFDNDGGDDDGYGDDCDHDGDDGGNDGDVDIPLNVNFLV